MAYLLPTFITNYFQSVPEKALNLGLEKGNVMGLGRNSNWTNLKKTPVKPEVPVAGPLDVLLLNGLESKKNGRITLYGQNTNGAGLDHIFSFVYYLPPTSSFEGSLYQFGLTAYLNMVHAPDFPFKCGMIIYTDAYTLPTLQKHFPEERFPNLTLAVVSWPYFSTKEGVLNLFILRTLRYHAVDHYSTKNVHMRDADTLFVAIGKWNFEGKVKAWEQKYLEFLDIYIQDKQIIIGANIAYGSDYHQNLPYPIEFTFPMRTVSGRGEFDKFRKSYPYSHLYLTANILNPENNAINTNISQDILYGKPGTYKAGDKLTKYTDELSTLQQELSTLGWYGEDNKRRNNIDKRKHEILNQAKQNFRESIPKERLQPVPFSHAFKKEFMYYPHASIYAGFVSVLKDRRGIELFWTLCVRYLLQRYRMTIDLETGEEVVTNELLKPGDDGHPIAMGKDERMILYGIVPEFISKILFLPIDYSAEKSKYGQLPYYIDQEDFFSLGRISKHRSENRFSLFNTFKEQSQKYKHWLAEFYKKYPTEESFLNKVNALLQENQIPLSNSRLQPLPVPGENEPNPYTAYNKAGRKATIRRGGARGGTRKRHVKKVQKQKTRGRK